MNYRKVVALVLLAILVVFSFVYSQISEKGDAPTEVGWWFDENNNFLYNYNSPEGYVGINMNEPNYPLDVNGIINGTSYYLNGSPLGMWGIGNENRIYYNSGSVGIGVAAPTSLLHLLTNGSEILTLQCSEANSSVYAKFKNPNYQWYLGNLYSSNDFFVGSNGVSTRPLIIEPGAGNNTLYLDAESNVGIGTNSPSYKLDVNGTISSNAYNGMVLTNADAQIRFYGESAVQKWSIGSKGGTGDGYLIHDVVNNVTRFFIDENNGNIGIGTTSPAFKLDVNGTGHFASNIEIDGNFDPGEGNLDILSSATTNNDFRSASDIRIGDYLNLVETGYSNLPIIASNAKLTYSSYGGVGSQGDGNLFTPQYSNGYATALEMHYDGWTRLKKYDYDGVGSAVNYSAFSTQLVIDPSGNVGIGTESPQTELAVDGTITAKEIVVTDTGWADFVFNDDYQLPTLEDVERSIKQDKHLPEIPSAKDVRENGVSLGEMQSKLLQKVEELTLYVIEQNKAIKALQKENNVLSRRLANLPE